jgi:hypothetical protein
MVVKRKQIRKDPFRLNEPVARIAGGVQRTSIVARNRAFASIRARERLYGVLLRHDPNGILPRLTARDMGILRQIAAEGASANHAPVIRRSAILLLATSLTLDNLKLLAELALVGEDFYVRSHALLALGETGLELIAPLLRDALRAKEATERQAAAAGLRALAHRSGPAILRVLRENERDDATRVSLDRILHELSEPPAKQRARRQTRSRNR